SSTLPFNITGNDDTTVIIAYNYTSPGEKEFICNINSSDGKGNKTKEFEIKGLAIENYDSFQQGVINRILSFDAKNYYHVLETNISVTAENNFSNKTTLNPDEFIMVITEVNYSSEGRKTANTTILSGNITDFYLDVLRLIKLELGRYEKLELNGTKRVLMFDVTNKWLGNLSVNFNLTEPSVNSSTNLVENETITVIVAENYTAGTKEPEIKAYSGKFLEALKDKFKINILKTLDFQVLKESLISTISEIWAKSNSGNNTIAWTLRTGGEIVSSNISISLNESESAMIIVEEDYSLGGIYITNVSVNSSRYNDSAL
ncbi:MAG: hypothetical protein AABY14_00825, partial [Nanoarchaeota archaeon]